MDREGLLVFAFVAAIEIAVYELLIKSGDDDNGK